MLNPMNSNGRISIFVLLLAVIFTSCAKLPVYQSQWEGTQGETLQAGYDKESRLRWQISNDATHLYIKLDTDNRMTIMKMIRNGLKIYLDTTGRKKDQTYVGYPVSNGMKMSKEDMKNTGVSRGNRRDVSNMLQLVPPNAEFFQSGSLESFNFKLERSDFNFSLAANDGGRLNYEAWIPLEKIRKGGLTAIKQLSIGIEANGLEMPSGGGGPPQMGGQRQGGGMPGGMPGGGRGGQGMRGPNSSMMEMLDDVTVWFKVELARK